MRCGDANERGLSRLLSDGNALAAGLTTYVRELLPQSLRGALPVRPPRGGTAIVGMLVLNESRVEVRSGSA
jgi:hypothetical protein